MSDDLEARGHHAITHDGESYIKLIDASVTFSVYRKDIAAKDAQITRLRAALATAQREGMEAAVSEAQARAKFWVSGNNEESKIRYDEARKIAAAIRAAAKEGKP